MDRLGAPCLKKRGTLQGSLCIGEFEAGASDRVAPSGRRLERLLFAFVGMT